MVAVVLMRWMVAALVAMVLLQASSLAQVDSAAAIAAATGLSRQVSTQEWLGPLSAIAISPFFGLACLSGVATYGPDWLQSRSSLFSESSPLNNPLLFWVMLGLTVVTSLPRLTKVSKPFSMAVEKLEMYSVIIIFLAMKFMSSAELPSEEGLAQTHVVMTAGIATMPVDVLFAIAAAMNIVVVNTIKLFIEVLVWLIPVPTIDAVLELGNKSLCVALMAIYAYSPLLATALNLCILGVCCLVFFRAKRNLAYMKELLLMPLLRKVMSWPSDSQRIVGFVTKPWNGLPTKSALILTKTGNSDQVQMVKRGWFANAAFEGTFDHSRRASSLLCDQITVRVNGSEVVLDVCKGTTMSAIPVAV